LTRKKKNSGNGDDGTPSGTQSAVSAAPVHVGRLGGEGQPAMTNRGNTTARGYGHEHQKWHQKLRKQVAALIAAGGAVCWRCGRGILPGMKWDLGHDDNDRSIYRGPEHARCNRSSAASRGNRMRGKQVKVKAVRRVLANTTREW
jgi:hypothetical protein